MGRRLLEAEAPKWFDLSRYDSANDMDVADWYLNFALRGEIARGHKDKPSLLRRVQGDTPLLRRDDPGDSFWFGLLQMPPDFREILNDREPSSGVEYLSTHGLYFFEKRLPDAIRRFGAGYIHGKTSLNDAPNGFVGPLDHAFDRRHLSVFARIDLSLPDDVLLHDLKKFLQRVRGEFAAVGGKQPYARALAELAGHKRARLSRFAKIQMLPLMDVEQWQRDEGKSIRPAPLARLLHIDVEDLREARKYMRVLLDDFALSGWLMRAAREAVSRSR
jgi:hypothetical protein